MKEVFIETKLQNKGHYVPGMISGRTLYISGQLPVHHETGAPMAETIEEQTKDALHNVELVLKAAGCTKDDVVLCRVYIPDVCHWDAVNAVYGAFFGRISPPALLSRRGSFTTGLWWKLKPSPSCTNNKEGQP